MTALKSVQGVSGPATWTPLLGNDPPPPPWPYSFMPDYRGMLEVCGRTGFFYRAWGGVDDALDACLYRSLQNAEGDAYAFELYSNFASSGSPNWARKLDLLAVAQRNMVAVVTFRYSDASKARMVRFMPRTKELREVRVPLGQTGWDCNKRNFLPPDLAKTVIRQYVDTATWHDGVDWEVFDDVPGHSPSTPGI
jgi:hypothetical protein